MLLAALRDMQWRKRRFVIAILSTAIIFAMTLVLTGLANGFRVEAEQTVDSLGVDLFVVKEGASGPFVGATPFAPVGGCVIGEDEQVEHDRAAWKQQPREHDIEDFIGKRFLRLFQGRKIGSSPTDSPKYGPTLRGGSRAASPSVRVPSRSPSPPDSLHP